MSEARIPTDEQLVEFKFLLNSNNPNAVLAFNEFNENNDGELFYANIIKVLTNNSNFSNNQTGEDFMSYRILSSNTSYVLF